MTFDLIANTQTVQSRFSPSNPVRGRTSPVLGATLGAVLTLTVASATGVPLASTGGLLDQGGAKKSYVVTNGGERLHIKVAPAIDSAPEWLESLRWIKSEADVTISALADLFGVTRRAFYSWLDGTTPKRGGSQARIALLRHVLAGLPSHQRSALLAVKDEVVDGVTFREVFQGPIDDVDVAKERLDVMVSKLASAMAQQERRLERHSGSSRSFDADFAST